MVTEVCDVDVEYYLAALERWEVEPWPPIAGDEREEVHTRLDELSKERAARVDAHRSRLAREAARLGRKVREHRVTLVDAERRLDELARATDPETPGTLIVVVDYQEAARIVRRAFAGET